MIYNGKKKKFDDLQTMIENVTIIVPNSWPLLFIFNFLGKIRDIMALGGNYG